MCARSSRTKSPRADALIQSSEDSTHGVIDLRRRAKFEVQLFDLLGEQSDLIQIKASDVTHSMKEIDGAVVDHADHGFEICRPLSYD